MANGAGMASANRLPNIILNGWQARSRQQQKVKHNFRIPNVFYAI